MDEPIAAALDEMTRAERGCPSNSEVEWPVSAARQMRVGGTSELQGMNDAARRQSQDGRLSRTRSQAGRTGELGIGSDNVARRRHDHLRFDQF